MDSFAKLFEILCCQSMGIAGRELLKDDPKQAAFVAKSEAIRIALIKKLDGNEKLLNAYDDAVNAVSCQPTLYIYQQGFQDSVHLLRWMGLLEGFPGREQIGRGGSS